MDVTHTFAEAALAGETEILTRLSKSLLVPIRNNFVERPWGGTRIRDYKRFVPLPDQAAVSGLGLGESFELAAFDDDDEARQHPSVIECSDGSRLSLPRLLELHANRILGHRFVERFGACFPLLPKTLDVKELLSVQGHPAGHTEVYIIIDAEPEATIRLGFRADVDGSELVRELTAALERQRELLALVDSGSDLNSLHSWVSPWLADRDDPVESIESRLVESLASPGDCGQGGKLLGELKRVYWSVLDSMNEIEVESGQVIHNATPDRLLAASGAEPAAEVHALGNPERREILALEIRRPGPTFRAWDNVRFPPREVDVAAAVAALNLRATTNEDFIRDAPQADAGMQCSVDSPYFRVEHWRPTNSAYLELPAADPYCLHVLSGDVTASVGNGEANTALGRGDSALVPVGVGALALQSTGPVHLVCVHLPEN